MSDQVSPATCSSVAGAAGRGSEAGSGADRPAADRPAAAAPASDPAPGRDGSLAAVLETLRNAASEQDSRAQPPPLPDTGPLPGEGKHRA